MLWVRGIGNHSLLLLSGGGGLDGGANGWVEVVGADQLDDAGVLQPVAHRGLDPREHEGNVVCRQRPDQVAERPGAGGVEVGEASASNTSQRTGVGAPRMASRMRPLT